MMHGRRVRGSLGLRIANRRLDSHCMDKLSVIAMAAAIGFSAPAAFAQDPEDPDWPCMQRKVPALSVIAVWSGPAIEEALTHWQADDAVAALVQDLAARRMPLEEATAAVSAFAQGLDGDAKAEKLTLLFAGLFETLDRERGEVMAGIDRYGRKQKQMAEQIRQEQIRLSDANAAAADPRQIGALGEQLVLQTRIFNERRASLLFVCEVPVIIEQRLFALAHAIQNELAT